MPLEFAILFAALATSLLVYFVLKICVRHDDITQHEVISRRVSDRSFILSTIAYAVLFGTLSILRFLSFNHDGYDLSIFDQAVWNSLNGRLLETSFLPDISFLLAQRFSPILLALVPLYAIWSSPIVLIMVQTIGIAAAAFPIYWLARLQVGNMIALILAWAFFLFPSLEFTNLFEFHELGLGVPLVSYACFFLLRGRWKPFLVLLLVATLVKEEIAFIIVGFGLYVFLTQRKRRLGIALVSFGVIWLLVLLQFLIPFFRGDSSATGYYYFGHGLAAGMGRYDYLGSNLSQIIITLITQPDIVLSHLLVPAKLEYILDLLLPIAFTSVIGIEMTVVALPLVAVSLLSDYPPQFSIEFYYTTPIFPALFFGAILGLRRLITWRSSSHFAEQSYRRVACAALILVASVATYYYQAPGPLAKRFDPSKYQFDAHAALGNSLVRKIPPEAVVVAQEELAPLVTERRGIYGFPPAVDYCRADYVFVDAKRPRYMAFEKEWNKWRTSGNFDLLVEQDGFVVAKRVQPNRPVEFFVDDRVALVKYTLGASELKRGSERLCVTLQWRVGQPLQARYIARVHLQDQRGHVFAQDEHEARWVASGNVVDSYSLAIPPTVPPGIFQIAIHIYDPSIDRLVALTDSDGRDAAVEPVIASVRVEKDTSSITAQQLRVENPHFVDIDEIRLLGYSGIPKKIAMGNTLALGLYWRARGKPRGDYEVHVQLMDATGRVVSEEVSRPADGAYPTTLWHEGEVLLDWHDLILSDQMSPGEYSIRITMGDTETHAVLGQAVLTSISIEKP